METVRKEIFDFLEDNEINIEKVANMLDCKKQMLSNFRNGKNIGFKYLISLARIINPKNYHRTLSKWCLKLDSVECVKNAFEYAALTRNVDLLSSMLNKHQGADGTIGECIKVYQIVYDYQIYNIKGAELVDILKSIKNITNKSLLILIEILKIYGLYYKQKYALMLELIDELSEQIEELSDKREGFIKDCFNIRLSDIYTPTYFHLNELHKVRIHANILINSEMCPRMVSDGYYYMGMTFLFEDKSTCLKSLQTSYEILANHPYYLSNQALSNLNFVRSFYQLELVGEEKDDYIVIYNKIKRGVQLSQIEISKLNVKGLSIFKRYYKALWEGDVKKLFGVLKEFNNTRNVFYARLVAHEITKVDKGMELVENLFKFSNEVIQFEENRINTTRDDRIIQHAIGY